MRIRNKLSLGFGIVIIMLITATMLFAWSLNRTQQATRHIENTFLQQMELTRLLKLVNRQMKELSEYVIMNEEEELAEFRESGREALESFDEWNRLIVDELDHADSVRRLEGDDELLVWELCKGNYLDLIDRCGQVIALAREGRSQQAIERLEYQVETACDERFKTLIDEQLQDERAEIAALQESTGELFRFTRRLTLAMATFALVGAALASRIVTRMIAEPLTRLREAASQIGQGRLDIEVDIPSRDEVGELAATLNQMARDLQRTTASVDDLRWEMDQRHKAEKDLEAINEELTHFAYVVSHDLKAPLRGIKLIAEWLCTDYGDQLGDEAKENFELLQSRVDRMHNLIEGVLQYSRVGRIREEVAEVDLNETLGNIIDAIAPPAHVAITIEGTLPTVRCEPTRISQVFQNLLTNAVKYMDKPAGKITVACQDDSDAWTFSVSDNGPGIEEKHFERIFKIFQTLAPRDEYESTGVGLTLVKKIIEFYGGRIWVASDVGQGSTFYFTWPRSSETADALEEAASAECSSQAEQRAHANDTEKSISDPMVTR